MYCKKCGSRIIEGNRFCEQCGTPVSVSAEGKARSSRPSGKGLRGKKLVAVIAAIVVLFGGIGTVTAMMTQQKNANYTDKIATAQKFLDEGNYESAMESFDEAIKIKPKKAEAYLAKANAQNDVGDWQGAMETLKSARKIVKDKDEVDSRLGQIEDENNEAMKNAYRKILEDNEDGIRLCEEDFDSEGEALIDINGDGTPELFFFTAPDGATQPWAKLRIYGFDGKKAKELKYKFPSTSSSDEDMTDCYDETASIDSASHIIFKSTDSNSFVIYSIGQYSGNDVDAVVEYSIDEKSNIDIMHYIKRDGEENKWYEDGEAIDEGRYSKAIREIADKVDKVMYLNGSGDEGDPIWEKADSTNPISVDYDSMIEKLIVKDSGSTEKKTKRVDWYADILSVFGELQNSIGDADKIRGIIRAHDKELPHSLEADLTEGWLSDVDNRDRRFFYQLYDLNGNGSDELYITSGIPNTDDIYVIAMYVRDGNKAKLPKPIEAESYFTVLEARMILVETPFGEGVSEQYYMMDDNNDELIEIEDDYYGYDEDEFIFPDEWRQITKES